jgi:hypothetical protein
MTTPDGDAAGVNAAGRVRRSPPQRGGPDRSGARHRHAPAKPAPADPSHEYDAIAIDDAIADSVKTAYNVLSETIEQGRNAAENFRHGDYNYRDVPADLRQVAANLLKLARQVSESTFEICEALLDQQMPGFPPPPANGPVPAFRDFVEKTEHVLHSAPPRTARPAEAAMRLSVSFVGGDHAVAHSTQLARPVRPTSPSDVTAAPLVTRDGKASMTGVTFDADVSHGGGLIAKVTVPKGQPPGVYTGTVYAAGQDLPLGQLVIELPAPKQQAGG